MRILRLVNIVLLMSLLQGCIQNKDVKPVVVTNIVKECPLILKKDNTLIPRASSFLFKGIVKDGKVISDLEQIMKLKQYIDTLKHIIALKNVKISFYEAQIESANKLIMEIENGKR